MGLTDDDVREILRIVDESDLDELSIQTDGFSLHIRRATAPAANVTPAAPQQPQGAAAATPAAPAAPTGAQLGEAARVGAERDGTVVVPSPMLGTFYRAEAPGAAPFVDVGATIGPETTVCIIEVMKMMNSVAAGVSGTVVEVCAENGALVEYGEPLLRVRAGGTD
jgi:acetyl-CoA carboxylase biotin carboxyl carrier protein